MMSGASIDWLDGGHLAPVFVEAGGLRLGEEALVDGVADANARALDASAVGLLVANVLLLPIVVLRADPPLLEVEVRLGNIVRIKSVVELVEDGAAAVVVVLGLLPRPHRPRHGHGLAPERAARPLQRALDGAGTCVWTLNFRRPRHRRNITPWLISARAGTAKSHDRAPVEDAPVAHL